jgi:CheY-like chemotaxis protein
MGAERSHIDPGQADVIEAGEELLRKAHAVARRIDRRVCKAMGRHGLPGPNGPDAPPDRNRVLVVEDQPDSREALRVLLEVWGYQVQTAGDGPRGVHLALGWRPQTAVVDIGLPVLDGYGVARRVRAALGGQVRLIALTAYGAPEDVRAAHAAGFDAHLSKPADPGVLSRVLRGA